VTKVANGQIYLRARHDDLELVSCPSPRPFGAAIFYARYVAPYPPDHRRAGQTTTELVDALRAAKVSYVIDPGTPALTKRDMATVKEAAVCARARWSRRLTCHCAQMICATVVVANASSTTR
jgi:hypothetical protein